MPLRTLLGYEPRQVQRTKYDDFGGKFLSFTPARSVIATKKAKYQAPMGRLRKLPPIDEELTPASTPRYRNRGEVTQPRITRLPKKAFVQPEIEEEPVRQKPVLSVRPIPREKIEPVYDDDLDKKLSNLETKYVFKHRTGPYPKETPSNINHTLVDGIVADYLHYARYGNIIPVYEGTSSAACPCCTDRNKQNVRTLLGLPKELAKPPPQKYDKQSKLSDLRDNDDMDEDTRMYPNSLYSYEKKRVKHEQNPTPSEKQRQRIASESQRMPWMNYQPLPYASNYLNPEFNRPSLTQDLLAAEAQRTQHKAKDRILEANSNYDSAMNKLETLAFSSGSYR